MTKLSKRPISDEKLSHCINNLWSAFILMSSKEEMRELFRDLFTHTEYKMFAKRLEIARLLIRGENYEDIMRQVVVSEKTIAYISNILESRGNGFRNAEVKLSSQEKNFGDKRALRQDVLERRVRPKPAGERVLPELAKVMTDRLENKIKGAIKTRSARKSLSVK